MIFYTSLICLDASSISNDIQAILNASKKDTRFHAVHADFMDGNFVPRLGIYPELIRQVRMHFPNCKIDSHLMVNDPFAYVDLIAPFSDFFQFHCEAVNDPFRIIQKLRKDFPNTKIGLCFNLGSTLESLHYFAPYIDAVTLMGISPGVLEAGSFPDIIREKVGIIRSDIRTRELKIFVDGAVNFETIPLFSEYGVNAVVCGSQSIMFEHRIQENIQNIQSSIQITREQ